MSLISKSKGQIVFSPPTIDPKSPEAKAVQVGERVRNVEPKKVGDIHFDGKKFWRVLQVHPIEYRSKYGKEWSYAHKALVQTWNVWIGDYFYTLQEVVYEVDWKFNIGEIAINSITKQPVVIVSRHGSICPWYKIKAYLQEEKEEILYEVALEKVSYNQKYQDDYWQLYSLYSNKERECNALHDVITAGAQEIDDIINNLDSQDLENRDQKNIEIIIGMIILIIIGILYFN